jgi:hypothetical protein
MHCYAPCHYAGCSILCIHMLDVIMPRLLRGHLMIRQRTLSKNWAQYSWPPCTNKFRSAPFGIVNILYFLTKQATLMWRSTHRYQKKKIDCLRFVMCLLLAPHLKPFYLFFLLWLLTVLMRQIRQPVHAINQSIFLRCLWVNPMELLPVN